MRTTILNRKELRVLNRSCISDGHIYVVLIVRNSAKRISHKKVFIAIPFDVARETAKAAF